MDDVSDALSETIHEARNVNFHFEVDGVPVHWGVRTVSIREAIGECYRATVEAVPQGDEPETASLLGRKVLLRIERGSQPRWIRGVVRQAQSVDLATHVQYSFRVVPSIWRLGMGLDSRVYRDATVPEIVERVIRERLGGAVRVDLEKLTQTYERHELLVQYQESSWNFLCRWMEQEGIFFFDGDSEEGESIVLADAMQNLPRARAHQGGRVVHRGPLAHGEDETVWMLRHIEEVGVTHVSLTEHDWTHPSLEIRAERRGRSPWDPPPEVYDHTDAVTFHRYVDAAYSHHTAERAAQIRAEVLELARQRWTMRSDVVSARPGWTLRVEGAPQSELDGAYLVVRSESGGATTEGERGSWHNSLVVVPTRMPYRMAPNTPRPVVSGPETAIVVGPEDQEIHTDVHGRVKVHFHWDRLRDRTDAESSCWIRVAQQWAGSGFGTFFLPRVGMEVIVSFLGGNPDRPLITGCVYNGDQHPPVVLDDRKTQSVIRTKSSPHSEGYNELRFEDESGNEFIAIHAQKDLHEIVENDHTTHVKHARTDRVDVDHEEHIGNNQTYHVENERSATVGSETLRVRGARQVTVGGDETLRARGKRTETVDGDYETTVNDGSRHIRVMKGRLSVNQGLEQAPHNHLSMGDCTKVFSAARIACVSGPDLTTPKAELWLESSGDVLLRSSDSRIELLAESELILRVGETSSITITSGEIKIKSPTIKLEADNLIDAKSALIKLNS